MKIPILPDSAVPAFCWDRQLTTGEIKQQIRVLPKTRRSLLLAWILREAPVASVWNFLTPKDLYDQLDDLRPFLGRRKAFWEYLMRTWHELGKI